MAYKLQSVRSGATAIPEKMLDFLSLKLIEQSGVFNIDGGEMLVTQKPAPALAVMVAMGAASLKKTDGSMVYPVNLEVEDAEIALSANASGNPRIDAVVLYVDLDETSNSDATNVAKLEVVDGSPAASPSAPSDAAIQSAIGASNPFIRLADVYVANGDTTITDANITDTREEVVMAEFFNQDFIVGDTKFTTNPNQTGRFLELNGDEIGNADSGADHAGSQYRRLFEHLDSIGLTPTAAWASDGKITLPNAYNRFIVVAGDTYDVLATGGTDSHLHSTGDHILTESEMPSHTHVQDAHGHTQAAHTHTINDAGHTHTIPFSNGDQDGSGSNGAVNGGATGSGSSVTGITLNNATPTINNATATNQETGGDAAHNHGNTGSTSHIPKYIALYAFIKY